MKTHWTPLTSQEQLDNVWDSMEVGSIIVVTYPRNNVYGKGAIMQHKFHMSDYIKVYYESYRGVQSYHILTPYINTGE